MRFHSNIFSDLFKRICRYQDFAFLLLLTILVVGFYHQVLKGWWSSDAPYILKEAVQYHPWEYYFIPHVWQELSVNNLTPWICLSFDLDIVLFGLKPLWFYSHQLISLWLAVITLYFVIRLYVPSTFAAIGSVLFVIGTPVTIIVNYLSHRHYLEGLVLALIAMYLFVKSLRTKRIVLAWVSGFVYILAMSAKEVYVPLVLAVLALPENSWRIRFKYAVPLLLALLFYIPWRMWMLGEAVGGYDYIVKAQDVLLLPQKILQQFFNFNTLWGSLTAFIVLGIVFGMSLRRLYVFIYTIWVCVLVLMPVVPLSPMPINERHVFVIWVTLCVGVSIGLYSFWKQSWWRMFIVGLMCLIMITTTAVNSNHRMTDCVNGVARWREEGRFILEEAGHKKHLIGVVGPGWFYDYLIWLRKEYFKRPEGPSVVYDAIFFVNRDIVGHTVWTYSTEKHKIIHARDSITDIVTKIKGQIRQEAPLSIRVSQEGKRVLWQLGPYHDGEYFALTGEYLQPYPVLREGAVKLGPNFGTQLQFRYDSPEGWTTYSPSFILSPETCPIVWKR